MDAIWEILEKSGPGTAPLAVGMAFVIIYLKTELQESQARERVLLDRRATELLETTQLMSESATVVKESLAEHDRRMEESLAEHGRRMEESRVEQGRRLEALERLFAGSSK